MILKRTNSSHKDFKFLVSLLDAYLRIIDGEEHDFYNSLNQLEPDVDSVICYINEVPVGCGAFKVLNGDTVEIKRMFVQPEYRGKGIALSILSELEKWAFEKKCNISLLETGNRMQDAVALYKKAGYHLIPNYGKYINVENSVCMSKSII